MSADLVFSIADVPIEGVYWRFHSFDIKRGVGID